MSSEVVQEDQTTSSIVPHHLTRVSSLSTATEQSADELSSDNRRVSFNSDVRVKKIPKFQQQRKSNFDDGFAEVRKEAPPTDATAIASEAARILRQLRGVECNVSPTPTPTQQHTNNNSSLARPTQQRTTATGTSQAPPTHLPPPSTSQLLHQTASPALLTKNYHSGSEEADSGLQVCCGSSSSPSNNGAAESPMRGTGTEEVQNSNHLFGLHALNNLDMAVNGRTVNAMPSYHEIRQTLDSSGNSGEYSPASSKRAPSSHHPPKPPRKAPSASPPSMRRSAAAMAHYAQPDRSSKMVSSVMEQLSQDARFRNRRSGPPTGILSGETSGDDEVDTNRRVSPSRLSPSRTCMTDTELLRSPTEVLYAVSDKYRHGNNERIAHSASQTTPHTTYDHRQPHRPVMHQQASSARHQHHAPASYSRSLDRYIDDDKENEFKARILVTSPDRGSTSTMNRKPYKTTINTATDNIQYRGEHEPPQARHAARQQKLYQKNKLYRRPESEHYKVPKNKAPVEFLRNGAIVRPSVPATDSDQSSSIYYHNGAGRFNSSRLVKSADSRARHEASARELDREGRTIRRERGRTYSGASTSPDREGSPDHRGYSRPRPTTRSHSNLYRSPSTSPTRPPRARSSPGRDLIASVVRRVTSRAGGGGSIERRPSGRSPFRDIQRVHSHVRSGPRPGQPQHQQRNYDDSEERLARFTEYRGDGGGGGGDEHQHHQLHRAFDSRRYHPREDSPSGGEDGGYPRERGQSLPPGAHIDSMRDFYKSAQFKSMYTLPPSPSRPAPVLERAPSASTLRRTGGVSIERPRSIVRPARISISEGEVTDEAGGVRRPNVRPQPPARRPSTKRQAPSPPGRRPQPQKLPVRRVVSSDREVEHRRLLANGRAASERRVVSSERGLQHPPQRRPLVRKTSMGDALDSSFSESEGFNADLEQVSWHALTHKTHSNTLRTTP